MSVYFAQVGPYIKIGYSTNPERRVRNLHKGTTRYSAPAGTPFDAASRRLIRAIDGTKQTERLIHLALAEFRIGTEWFVDEPEVREFIATVETAEEYEPVKRPDGPAWEMYDERRDLDPVDLAQLQTALDSMFKRAAT